jgi:hypothetical protein
MYPELLDLSRIDKEGGEKRKRNKKKLKGLSL